MARDREDKAPRERALRWWRGHASRNRYVIGRDEFPGPAESRFLRSGGYVLEVAAGAVWILARPGVDTLPDAFFPNYWTVVRILMESYAPAVVERVSAVRLYTDQFTPPAELTIRQGANASNRTVELVPGHVVVIRAGEVDLDRTGTLQVAGVPIPVEDPAATLLGLPVGYLRDDPEAVALWLMSLIISRKRLEEAYAARPRPVVLKRLGEIARAVGNTRLAELIEEVLRGEYAHRLGRGHTARGPRFVVPAHVADLSTTFHPWLDRQAATFARFREAVEEEIGAAAGALPRSDLDALLAQAREAKAYDAYHSTTIEGYRISPEEVSAVIRGAPVGGHEPEDVRARTAVAGYAQAFERVLAAVREAGGRVQLTEPLIQELYLRLFGPSVDAGIVPEELLRGWRTEPAYLRGHAHVPPAPEKLPQLMRQYVELVNSVEGRPSVRAILAHLEFVTVHPYPDGNGRLARFLMNLALLGEGLPWVTIRSDDRPRYFGALHAAQVDGDVRPFARFALEYLDRTFRAREG